ncbi:hypothetical protein C8R44DRAFT_893579 [Mycena epipterygia]|nr:hypothetical protein C8R44DRAFT_893579 [Mycena epipterygia]
MSAGIAAAWEAQLCDVVVFGFTLFRSYRQPDKLLDQFCSISASLLNCATDFQLSNPWITSSLSWFMSTLSVTMISRFMLNPHKAADVGIVTDESFFPSFHFPSRHIIHGDEESNLCGED